MTTTSAPHPKDINPRVGRVARFAVWSLLVFGFVAGIGGAQTIMNRDAALYRQLSAAAASAPATVTSPVPASGASQGADIAAKATSGARAPVTYTTGVAPGDTAAATLDEVSNITSRLPDISTEEAISIANDPLQMSPAWRWTNLPMNQDVGWDRAIDSALNILCSLFFAIGAWIWRIILFMVRMSSDADIIGSSLAPIDKGVKALADQPLLLAVVGVGWFVTLWRMGKLALKGNVVKMMSTAVAFLIPIAFLFYIRGLNFSAAEQGTRDLGNKNAAAYVPPQGSPAWMAQWTTKKLDVFGSFSLTLVNSSVGSYLLAGGNSSVKPWCTPYVTELNNIASRGSQDVVLTSVGSLWEAAYLNNWINAAFGDTGAGNSVYCHYLDSANGISIEQQQDLQEDAYPKPGAGARYIYEALYDTGDGAGKVALYSWIACQWNGSEFVMVDDWSKVKADNDNVELDNAGAGAKYCAKWYFGGGETAIDSASKLTDRESERSTLQNYIKLDGESADNFAHFRNDNVSDITLNAPNARAVADAFMGRNSTIRLGAGLIALITAAFYGFALIGLSAGALLSQFAVVLLLVFLPVTLVLLALGSDKGQKLLRMTIGLLATKLLFSLLLTVMVAIITLGVAVVVPLTEGISGEAVQAGFVQSMAISMIPLGALWVVRRIAGAAGLGNITSLKGGMGFTMAAAQKASRAGSLSDLTGSKMNDTMAGRLRGQAKDKAKGHGKNLGRSMVPSKLRNHGKNLERKRLGEAMVDIDTQRDALRKKIDSGELDSDEMKAAKARLAELKEKEAAAKDGSASKGVLMAQRKELEDKINGDSLKSPNALADEAKLDQLDGTHHSLQKQFGMVDSQIRLDEANMARYQKGALVALSVAGAATGVGAIGAALAATGVMSAATGLTVGAARVGYVQYRRHGSAREQSNARTVDADQELNEVVAQAEASFDAEIPDSPGDLTLHTEQRDRVVEEAKRKFDVEVKDQVHTVSTPKVVTSAAGRSASELVTLHRAEIISTGSAEPASVVLATAALSGAQQVAEAMRAPELVTASYQQGLAADYAARYGLRPEQIGVSDQGIPVPMPHAFTTDERMALPAELAGHPAFALAGSNLSGVLGIAQTAVDPSDAANAITAALAANGTMRVEAGSAVFEDAMAAIGINVGTALGRQMYSNIVSGAQSYGGIGLSDDVKAGELVRGLDTISQPGRDAQIADFNSAVGELKQLASVCRELTDSMASLKHQAVTSNTPLMSALNDMKAAEAGISGGEATPEIRAEIGLLRQEVQAQMERQANELRAAINFIPGLGGAAAGIEGTDFNDKKRRAGEVDAQAEALSAELERITAQMEHLDPTEVINQFQRLAGVVADVADHTRRLVDVAVPEEPASPQIGPKRTGRTNRSAVPTS